MAIRSSCEGYGHRLVGTQPVLTMGSALQGWLCPHSKQPVCASCSKTAAQVRSRLHYMPWLPSPAAGNWRCHLLCRQLSWGKLGCSQVSQDGTAEADHHAGVRIPLQRLATMLESEHRCRSWPLWQGLPLTFSLTVPNFLQKRLQV